MVGCCLVAVGCAASDPAIATRASLGEPMDGFPIWEERVVHVWTNRARQDPAADLASCAATVCAEKACYTAVPPLVWNHSLARAARFHSDNLARGGCSLQHDSPCTLVSDLSTRYTPGTCDGSPSCACTGGSATCGSVGTGFGARIGLFGGSARAENIATGSDPVTTFYRWLHEPDSSSACGWRPSNGHRANILGDSRALGVGKTSAGNIWTQDFGSSGTPDGLVGGVHYPRTGASLEFRATWHRPGSTPTSALVNVDGTCTPLTLERGSADRGTYLAAVTGISGCARYYFQFADAGGDVLYPTTGAYGIGCPDDWNATRPSLCGCTPSCGGRTCGDDGCGGSCGACAGGRTCSGAGACACPAGTMDCGGTCAATASDNANCGSCGNACASGSTCMAGICVASCTPSCGGRTCGDDGCGGSCGSCPAGRTCGATGACGCAAGRTDCGGTCVDTATDPSHCGGCGSACPAGQSCSGATCACMPSCGSRSCGSDGCGGTCGVCATDRVCSTGACTCLGALTDCAGACVDVRIDEANCGTCGTACAAGETCAAGACATSGPDAGCAPACAGRSCGDDTCGGTCGDCGADLSCGGGGQCLCPDAGTSCGGACVDLRTDGAHCGACDAACASDQRCVAGACAGGGLDGGPGAIDAGIAGDAGDVRTLIGRCGCRAVGAGTSRGPWWLAIIALAPWLRKRS